jgi:hypothetical protein
MGVGMLITVPAERKENCDAWGNLRGKSVRIIEERRGDNFINIFIYEYEHYFYYGYQLKVGTMIKQKLANIKDKNYSGSDIALAYANAEIKALCDTNKNVRKLFVGFTKIRYNQPELF